MKIANERERMGYMLARRFTGRCCRVYCVYMLWGCFAGVGSRGMVGD